MLRINDDITIPDSEIDLCAIRSQGPGGQNVNKVTTAIHLRFDINASSLPDLLKARLLHLSDQRINNDGVVVIKAQHRSQEKSKEAALTRLQEMILSVSITPKARKATKPTRSSQLKRLDSKNTRGKIKATRGKVAH